MFRPSSSWFAVVWCVVQICAAEHAGAQSSGDDWTNLPPPAGRSIGFAEDIYPLLRERCFTCHQGSNPDSGVRLDHHAKLLGETDGLPLIVPGNSAHSRLIQLVSRRATDTRMPPPDAGPPLSDQQIGLLRAWIDQGASWDEKLLPDPNLALAAKHWSFRPIVRPPVPDVRGMLRDHNSPLVDDSENVHPIDAFIGAVQSEHNLTAAESAPKRTLIRRLYQVLHAMPPSPDQVRQFTADTSSVAWQLLVDRVLHSEHYGERMARHWLDSARWAESEGFAQNNDRPFAWRYRDYVIHSFNEDKPYSEFLRQQIAGDELEPYADENLIATGYLAAARISADDLHFYRVENDMYTDIVNALSTSVLGLTVGCAQCHDHKFDPISQRDFYRLQAFFKQGLPGNVVLADAVQPDELEQTAAELLAFDLQVRRRVLSVGFDEQSPSLRNLLYTSEADRSPAEERTCRPAQIKLNIRVAGCNGFRIRNEEKTKLEALRKQLQGLETQASQAWAFYSPVTSPHDLSTLPMKGNFPLLHDRQRLAGGRSYLLAGGRVFEPVAVVTPGWPTAFGPTISPRLESRPRTALSEWLTSRSNPLTARVWVNRIWQIHFGKGLVETPGNFGVKGGRPSHPQLLDWLASELMDHDWSTKHVHRLIVTSRVWRQSSKTPGHPSDPQNRHLSRWPRRRLEAEAIRDSMLAASGELDRTVGGVGVPTAEEAISVRRGLYLFQKRDAPPEIQQLFDGPTAMSEACVERQISTSPLQSLYLLNNDFSRDRSRALANRITADSPADIDRQIQLGFRLALGRQPDEIERKASRNFFVRHHDRSTSRQATGSTKADQTAKQQVPAAHPGLWLRADAGVLSGSGQLAKGAENVGSWIDQTVGDNSFADRLMQATRHRQPRFVDGPSERINGLPVVRFSGGPFGQADHFISGPDKPELTVTDGYTLFAVVRFNGKGQRNEVVFIKARNGGNDIAVLALIRMASSGQISVGQNIDGAWADRVQSSQAVPDGIPVMIVARWNGSRLELNVQNHEGVFSADAVSLIGQTDPGAGGEVGVGGYVDAFSHDGERLNGDIGEILFYGAALSDSDMAGTVEYLKQRWLGEPPPMSPVELFSQTLLNVNEFLYIE
ncbi:MAG: PSD1 and planctomycete cytochrome C domain-containing protein [Planctomycetaceae bacterium]